MACNPRAVAPLLLLAAIWISPTAGQLAHPRLMADQADIDRARAWIKAYPWYRQIFDEHKKEIDRFIAHGPVYVSPLKQTYQYQMYTCPKHGVELVYDEFKPFEHRCPVDTGEVYRGGKYDMAWAGWYNRLLANHLVWMGLLYSTGGEEKYAAAGKEILMKFADLYLKYPTENTILGPAHVFFGTLSESFWGVDMAYGYDLLYNYPGFSAEDRSLLKEKLFYPLAHITRQFPETASNRQLWYNNVSAAVGFLYGDTMLIDFAIKGKYGFQWQLGSALPESGFWPEWSGYHFVALRGMIHLAEMARHNGSDLYHAEIAGRTMKKMFDSPFLLSKPNYEFPRCKDSGGGSILEYAPFYEVGYAVYRDPKYLSLLNLTHLERGSQVVGETSALGKAPEPITLFELVPELPPGTTPVYWTESINLEGNGFAVLRNREEQTYLYLDYGIMGGEHGHPDRLQMGYFAKGRNWIVDPLNESYMNPNLQLWYRQSIAHNTLVVDQTSQTWTNGYGNYFGALPSLQVASGGCSTSYPGVTLTRTLVQADGYFLDLFDAKAPEQHLYDLPLHGFGRLTVTGLQLEQQPIDLFGNRPGVPGYDQLTDISLGQTGGTWNAVFDDKGKFLSLTVLGEPGTEVLQAMNPPIGGFYKQMVTEQVRLPMVMARRKALDTRFAGMIRASDGNPSPATFERGTGNVDYVVREGEKEDFFHVDVDRSIYWLLREQNGSPSCVAGFNLQELRRGSTVFLSSPFPLGKFQCTWTRGQLAVVTPEQFLQVRIKAPEVSAVTLNGTPVAFEREGEYVIVSQGRKLAMTVTSPRDSMLFAGRENMVTVKVWNPTGSPVRGKVTITLAHDWNQRLQSQLAWWGGIVNLVATNKGPVERTTFPSAYRQTVEWVDGVSSDTRDILPRGARTFVLNVKVPGDAAPAMYPAIVTFDRDTLPFSFVVRAPVTARLTLPNGEKEMLWMDLTNATTDRMSIQTRLIPDTAWKTDSSLWYEVHLRPLETRRIRIPLRLAGYLADNQRYPIRLELNAEEYRTTIMHDFYALNAHFAAIPPALDGSWKGWIRTHPALINQPTQIGRLLFGNQPWHGIRDLSAEVYAMYDNDYLYIAAAVVDDSLVVHWDFPRMSYPWDTDCMEVVLDVRRTSGQGQDPPTPGLFRHLSLAEYRVTDFSAEAWQGAGAGGPLLPKPNLVPGAETYFHRAPNGYSIIARYPLSSLNGIVARPGSKIGFDVAINDNDGTNYRKNQHIWAGYNQNQSWWDMGTIGALIFGPKK